MTAISRQPTLAPPPRSRRAGSSARPKARTRRGGVEAHIDEFTLRIPGFRGSTAAANTVRTHLALLDGVQRVAVDPNSALLAVWYCPQRISRRRLRAAVDLVLAAVAASTKSRPPSHARRRFRIRARRLGRAILRCIRALARAEGSRKLALVVLGMVLEVALKTLLLGVIAI